ncbi:hypothetical protein SCA6_014351 [Theobroma cacao]
MYSSDVKPTTKQLWKPHIGVLEMGILGATRLMPMKIKKGKGGTTDAYCVSNIITTVGARDSRIGKVRIRLSTLESDRVYTHSYLFIMLHTSGVKKMDELHLAVRFLCANMGNMLHMYTLSLLPKMHYVHYLSVNQLESLSAGSDLDIHPTWTPDSPMLRMFIQMNCMRNLTHSQQVKVHMCCWVLRCAYQGGSSFVRAVCLKAPKVP